MCMMTVTEVKEPEKLPRFAYKVVKNPYVGPFSEVKITRGVWQDATNEPELKAMISYPFGFHVFPNKRDAKTYTRGLTHFIPRIEKVEICGPAYKGDVLIDKNISLVCYSVAKIRFRATE